MALSSYFSDSEVISQLRMFFELEEMETIDFESSLSQVVDYDENNFYLKIKSKSFVIDKLTGIVEEVA